MQTRYSTTLRVFFDQLFQQAIGVHDFAAETKPLVGADLFISLADLIGDGILIYRCWIIWGKNHLIIIIPSLCAVGGFGTHLTLFFVAAQFTQLCSLRGGSSAPPTWHQPKCTGRTSLTCPSYNRGLHPPARHKCPGDGSHRATHLVSFACEKPTAPRHLYAFSYRTPCNRYYGRVWCSVYGHADNFRCPVRSQASCSGHYCGRRRTNLREFFQVILIHQI